jgi:integrase
MNEESAQWPRIATTELRALRRWSRAPQTSLAFNDPRLRRFRQPIIECCERININERKRFPLVRFIFDHMALLAKPYWQWSTDEWAALSEETVPLHRRASFRPQVVLLAFHLAGLNLATEIMPFRYKSAGLASALWGAASVQDSISLVRGYLLSIGYRVGETQSGGRLLRQTLVATMLALKEPDVRRWDEGAYYALIRGQNPSASIALRGKRRGYALSAALALHRLGIFAADPQVHVHGNGFSDVAPIGYTPEWEQWIARFVKHSVAAKARTEQLEYFLRYVGRWVWRYHPEASRSPADWDVEVAADFAAFVANGKIGDLQETGIRYKQSVGNPLSPNTKAARFSMIRAFFDTLIESGLIRRRFTTRVVFRLPDEISRQAAPQPRDLEDDVWAKLLWAGLNLERADLGPGLRNRYPIEMLQAIAVVWLFAGLRSSELRRLDKDCIRWEYTLLDATVEGELPSICYLTVPTNKYKPEFRKPVAGEVGKALEAWLAIRPHQPGIIDPKTLRCEDKLFCVRGRLIGGRLLRSLIRSMCAKAGVPDYDHKGPFTVHRARSTIATQLANAKEPMSPWELKEWLGHSSIRSTEWYVNQRPLTLAKKYAAADSWRRNLARVKVILDADVIESGAAAQGAVYRAYDLGHGYCTDRFFSRCPHRMACARCGYYVPKDSTKGELLAAAGANQMLYEEIPIRDEERLALDGDAEAIRQLVSRLNDVPAADGRTPLELQAQAPRRLEGP